VTAEPSSAAGIAAGAPAAAAPPTGRRPGTIAGPGARSPLHDLAGPLAAASTPNLTLREVPFLTQVGLRIDPADAERLGLDVPSTPNTVASAGDRRTLWLGPDEWLVVDAPGTAPALVADLEAATADVFATVVDLSANRTTIELSGPAARDLLAQGCALDLHPRVFTPATCAQTLFARTQVILDQLDDQPTYRLHVRGSFAAHLAAWLIDATPDLGLDG
jgi:sarcosine oxidase subunit gamma